ncbi:MAG: sulfatase activating formylglycine-generating enzyme [Myxococcota bacterium]|jgi:formylglycine-generating enzyme required for sulfatase activity
MDELPPIILAELRVLADRLDSADAREALLTSAGQAAFERFLRQHASRTMVPELLDDEAGAGAATPKPVERVGGIERYEDRGRLGFGGMGEVRLARDPSLNRAVALKIIRPERLNQPGMLARFIEEAQITAQLSHPGIVPVHELGRLPDGRYYFTMKQIQGETLAETIRSVHSILPTTSGWNVRRLLDAFLRVCEAVAYAHARGVVHRDLKPSNVMLGAFGEVLVLDWGLAKVIGRAEPTQTVPEPPVTTGRDQHDGPLSRAGRISGTPTYMPPEQARGLVDQIGPPSDVYALGAVLFELLCGRAPFEGADQRAVLKAVRAGQRQPFPEDLHTPKELVAICDRAMAYEAADRYPDAQALHTALRDWLQGATRRAEALSHVQQADNLRPRAEQLRTQAAALRAEAAAALGAVEAHEPEERKLDGWALDDRAVELEQAAALAEQQYVELLQTALKREPTLPEAHARLSDLYRARHEAAEVLHDRRAAALHEALLESHDRGRHRAYLTGDGALTLQTDPPGAEAILFRYEPHRRRLRPTFVRSLGHTPLVEVSLPMGSYLLLLRAPGCESVRYPIDIGRQERWESAQPVWLPPLGAIGAGEVYVAGGPAWVGGDAEAYQARTRQRVWIDGFCILRHPVTNQLYLDFLNDLVDQGLGTEAERWAPREQGAKESELGPRIYGRHPTGHFFLRPDAEGDLWRPDWPVVMVDRACAQALAGWLRDQTGHPWRLPQGLEREKAARGVDGRFFPWGDFADPAWSCTQLSHRGSATLTSVDTFPIDESPYGVRHLAGMVRDWCIDAFTAEAPLVPGGRLPPPPARLSDAPVIEVCGGSWNNRLTWARAALRFGYPPSRRFSDLGIRLIRSIP